MVIYATRIASSPIPSGRMLHISRCSWVGRRSPILPGCVMLLRHVDCGTAKVAIMRCFRISKQTFGPIRLQKDLTPSSYNAQPRGWLWRRRTAIGYWRKRLRHVKTTHAVSVPRTMEVARARWFRRTRLRLARTLHWEEGSNYCLTELGCRFRARGDHDSQFRCA